MNELQTAFLYAAAAMAAVCVLTPVFIRWVHRANLLDTPDHRAMHQLPTPTSGGVVFIGVFTLFSYFQWDGYWVSSSYLLALVLIAAISLIDDHRPLSPLLRLTVQAFALVLIAVASPAAEITLVGFTVSTLVVITIWALTSLWLINLYNFMDGMDGLAASQLITACLAWAIAAYLNGAGVYLNGLLILAASVTGFLLFNWPPAKLFMGDVGSTTLGFVLAYYALWGVSENYLSLWSVLISLIPFWLDATYTLVKRAGKGEKVWQAHKEHFYQRLVHGGEPKRRVLLGNIGLMIVCGVLSITVNRLSDLEQAGVLVAMVVMVFSIWHFWLQRTESKSF